MEASSRRYLRWLKRLRKFLEYLFQTVSHPLNSLLRNHPKARFMLVIGRINRFSL